MKPLRALAASAILAAAISAPAAAAAADGDAHVRVLHASPDAPAVDVWLDGTIVDALTNVPFSTISDYLPVPAGSHQVQVFATGTDSSPVIDTTVDLAADTAYTVAATNVVASIEAQILTDDPSPTADSAQIRVVHFSADAPAVDVAPDGGDPIVSDLAYPNASGYLDVPADEYDLEVRAAGTSDVALQLDPVTVEAGNAYSVFAIGSASDGGEPLQVVIAADAEASPEPDMTTPPTDTVAPSAGRVSGNVIAPAVLLTAGGLLVTVGLLRLSGVRTRR
jgi:hypothetical protein